MAQLYPKPKTPPTLFGGLVLVGVGIIFFVVLSHVFESPSDSTLTLLLVGAGLILIAMAFPVYRWEKDRKKQDKKEIHPHINILRKHKNRNICTQSNLKT